MRFSLALGGLLCQTLPATTRAKFEDRTETALFERRDQHSHDIQSLVENGPGKLFWRLREKKRELKSRLISRLEQTDRQVTQALKNTRTHQADGAECDPFSDTINEDADVGILRCDVESYCKVDKTSNLGGFCTPLWLSKDRELQVLVLPYQYNRFCDEESDYFVTNLNCTMTCADFDPVALAGSFSCTDGCVGYTCQNACLSYELDFLSTGPDDYGYTACYKTDGPDGPKSFCYSIITEGGYYGTISCTATWNGNECTCIYPTSPQASVDVNCTDGQDSITGSIYELSGLFLEKNDCVADETICQGRCGGGDTPSDTKPLGETTQSEDTKPPDNGPGSTPETPGETTPPEDTNPPDNGSGSTPETKIISVVMGLSSLAVALYYS